MGTRSRIGVMHGDVCKSVYCHWDGYLDHNGRILQEHYDSARANHLVALGDISSLGRDRGEQGTEFKSAMTFADFMVQVENCGAEYYYIMKDGVWYTGCPGEGDALVPLATALAPVAKTWETVDL